MMLGLFKRKPETSKPAGYVWQPDAPLLRLSSQSVLTREAATQNILIMGGTGAGKTSASGAAIGSALLDPRGMNASMLICTAKGDEVDLWKHRAADAGRSADLRIIEPGGYCFNPVSYELARKGAVASAENVVGLLNALMECGDRQSATSGQDREPFFRYATTQLTRNIVDLNILATGTTTIDAICRTAISAPQTASEIRSDEWKRSSYCFQLLREADARLKTPSQARDFGLIVDYFLNDFANLAQRTKSNIVTGLTSKIDPFQRGVLRDLYGSDSTVTPEDCENGAIIIVGLPTQTWRETGLLANVAMKYCWARSMESRRLTVSSRPGVLWCDEFQQFATSYDASFLATCRSSRVGCALLTQGVPGVQAALGGGDKGHSEAAAIFGQCTVKVFHANSCPESSTWASTVIGRTRQLLANGNQSYSADDQWSASLGLGWLGQQGSSTAGFSETYEYEVQPQEFTTLRTGGPRNNWLVDAVVFQNGKVFPETGRTWLPVTFRQRR